MDGFIGWGKRDFTILLFDLKQYVNGIIFGDYIYCGKLYFLSIVTLISLAIYNLFSKSITSKIKTPFLLFIALAPFIMPFVLGAPLPIRSQVTLPLIIAFTALWSITIFEKKIILKNIIVKYVIVI